MINYNHDSASSNSCYFIQEGTSDDLEIKSGCRLFDFDDFKPNYYCFLSVDDVLGKNLELKCQDEELIKIIRNNAKAITIGDNIGRSKNYEYSIQLKDTSKPIVRSPYRYGQEQQKFMEET